MSNMGISAPFFNIFANFLEGLMVRESEYTAVLAAFRIARVEDISDSVLMSAGVGKNVRATFAVAVEDHLGVPTVLL